MTDNITGNASNNNNQTRRLTRDDSPIARRTRSRTQSNTTQANPRRRIERRNAIDVLQSDFTETQENHLEQELIQIQAQIRHLEEQRIQNFLQIALLLLQMRPSSPTDVSDFPYQG